MNYEHTSGANNDNARGNLSGSSKSPSTIASVGIAAGDCYEVIGRRVRIEKIHDNEVMELTDLVTMGNVQLKSEDTGELIPATLDWFLDHILRGEVRPLDAAKPGAEFELRDKYGDPDYLTITNPDAIHRRSLCARIAEAGVSRTDKALANWGIANFGMHPDDRGYTLPAGSTLKRWMREYDEMGPTPYTLLFQRGRKHGFSPLDPILDGYTHAVAEGFYASPRATMASAHDQLFELTERYNATLPEGAPKLKCPTAETVRKRIKKLRNRARLEKKFGKQRAAQLCDGSGEPLRTTQPLEVAMLDCTMLDQVVVFDEKQKLAACRVRLTAVMCAHTEVILGHKVHPGPERAETSIEAVIDAATPPHVPERLAELYPIVRWMFGKVRALLPDNAKSLIGPSTLRSFVDAGIGILEPPVEMPQAKAALERAFGTIKMKIAHLPGTVVDPKRRVDPDRDPVKEACITLGQLEEIVNNVIWTMNCLRPADDEPSPAERWEEYVRGNALPVVVDIKRLRRQLGKTYTLDLTYDGIVLNSIRYREPKGVTRLIDGMADKSGGDAKRRDGKLAFEVTAKLNPGDIDTIQVYDEDRDEWVQLYSTQPGYTRGLTEWEHNTFKRMARQRNAAFNTEKERKRLQYQLFASIEDKVPQLAFQRRKDIAALSLCHYAKDRQGKKDKLVREITDDALAVIAPQNVPRDAAGGFGSSPDAEELTRMTDDGLAHVGVNGGGSDRRNMIDEEDDAMWDATEIDESDGDDEAISQFDTPEPGNDDLDDDEREIG